MDVCLSSALRPEKTKWSFAIAAWRGKMVPPPVIWLKVWMANGAVQAEVQCVAPEDVADPVAADDHQLETDFFGDRLQTGRAHLTRRADAEPLAGDNKRLPSVDTFTKVRHQVAEGADPPALIEPVQALRDTVVGGSDLVGVDGVQLLPRHLRVPEDQDLPPDQAAATVGRRGLGLHLACPRSSGLWPGWLDRRHWADASILAYCSFFGASRSRTASAAASVDSSPPRSRVVHRARTAASTASSIAAAAGSAPRWRSISAPDRMAPSGFAIPLPACLGADPCTGSNRPRRESGLMLPDGARPSPPTSCDVRSLRMSPNMFEVTSTSKRLGSLTSCMAATSTKRCSASIPFNWSRSSVKTRCHRSCA